jgi:hypothetical protein
MVAAHETARRASPDAPGEAFRKIVLDPSMRRHLPLLELRRLAAACGGLRRLAAELGYEDIPTGAS